MANSASCRHPAILDLAGKPPPHIPAPSVLQTMNNHVIIVYCCARKLCIVVAAYSAQASASRDAADRITLCCVHERICLMREQVEKALAEIRPALQAHGGDVELIDVSEDGVVKVKLTGACGGCPMAQMTLKQGVERGLKERVPSVARVDAA